MNRQLRRWWKRQQGAATGAMRRWWKRQRTALYKGLKGMVGGAPPQRRRQPARRPTTSQQPGGLAFPPVVQTFLAGGSVRECAHRHWQQAPSAELAGAGDWPAAVRLAEATIRAQLVMLAEEVIELRTEIEARQAAQQQQVAP